MAEEDSGKSRPAKRRNLYLPFGLIVVALLGAALLRYWPQSAPPGEDPGQAEPVAEIAGNPAPPQPDEPLAEAGVQLSQTQPAPATTGPSVESRAQLEQLEQALQAAAGTVSGLNNAITALEARVAALEAAAPAAAIPDRLTQAFALRELERALAGSGPFQIELQAVAKAARLQPDDAAVSELQKYAAVGIDSRPAMAAQFAPVARDVVRADAVDRQLGAGGRLYAWFSALITVRPLGEQLGDDAPAIVARAEARLAQGDLDAAARELAGLRNGAALTAAPWLAQAQARLTSEQALATLNARLTGQQE